MEKKTETKKDPYGEVSKDEAKYLIIQRPNSYETSVHYYETLEDAQSALKDGYFSEQIGDSVVGKILDTEVVINDK